MIVNYKELKKPYTFSLCNLITAILWLHVTQCILGSSLTPAEFAPYIAPLFIN